MIIIISSRSFASHEALPPFRLDLAQATLLVERRFRSDEIARFFPDLPASCLPVRQGES